MTTEQRILVVDDEAVIREGLRRILSAEGYAVETFASGYAAVERLQESDFDLVITDLKMPGMSGLEVLHSIRVLQPEVPVLFITGYAAVDSAVEVMRGGAVDYVPKPFTPEEIVGKVHRALEERGVLLDDIYLRKELRDVKGFDCFVGTSREMEKVYRRIMQVAPTESSVLITGESGTGKELVAQAIHRGSPRREQPFVAVDCTSLAENLLESELFGHIKGSFTGAVQAKTGLFKVADGGTLFLDEVANLSPTIQAKLLRVLQERAITPIGGTRPEPIDIRLVAATNRNLRELVAAGSFREDLFFRLHIIPIDLPPLRDRKGDLPLLIGHFVRKYAEELGKEIRGLAPDALALLEGYPFPGNVRELKNVVERAVVLCEGRLIRREVLDLDPQLLAAGDGEEATAPRDVEELKECKRQAREQAVEPVERAFILQALERNNWNVTRAAEETGMQRPNFQALLKKHGISVRNYLANG